jgi:uncharacterized membrane-anchored protein
MPSLFFATRDRTRLGIIAVTVLGILLLVNTEIFFKERIVRDGDRLLLRLAPRDPRSLFQGDYMALRYAMEREVTQAATKADQEDGYLVVDRLPSGEVRFNALYRDQALTADQHLLRFRRRGSTTRLASDAYFFQEGDDELYTDARYGELHVDAQGEAVLTGLLDEAFKPLGSLFH